MNLLQTKYGRKYHARKNNCDEETKVLIFHYLLQEDSLPMASPFMYLFPAMALPETLEG